MIDKFKLNNIEAEAKYVAATPADSWSPEYVKARAAEILELVEEVRRLRGPDDDGQFYVGDKVKLAVTGNPDDGDEPETGVVMARSGPGYLVKPDTGDYVDTKSGLYYGPHEVSALA